MADGQTQDVGIDGIEIYFPRSYVDQQALETFDGASTGKYTIGLGQQQMGFCADNEDIVSISMTVTKKLLETYQIPTDSIGCLVVGTETLIDKSKSVKTSLMDLFGTNTDIEGVDIKNACYGGAQALLHAVDWVKVNHFVEQKNAIVVIADIAIYEAGPARCTGGAGAMAFLIRPNAAIPIDRILSACHMKNSWDFYKPISSNVSEYPKVNGSLSLVSYLEAVRMTYTNFKNKVKRFNETEINIDQFSAVFMHSPFAKMVEKGFAVMNYADMNIKFSENGKQPEVLDENDRADLSKMIKLAKESYEKKTSPYLIFNRRIGNMYTPSVFAQLLAFVASDDCVSTPDSEQSVLFFAYGSGLASSIFPARIVPNASLDVIRSVARQAVQRLDSRQLYTAEEFTEFLNMRERFLKAPVPSTPESLSKVPNSLKMFDNTFYLEKMDETYRRTYKLYEEPKQVSNGNGIAHHH